MEKILDNFIKEINELIGVRAAYLVNNRGEILIPFSEPMGRSSINAEAALSLIQAMGIFEIPGEDIQEMELEFMNGKIVVYHNVKMSVPTKLGAHEAFLVILGDERFSKAHLRLALNVTVSNVVTHKKYKKIGNAVNIRKTSVITREKLSEEETGLVAAVRKAIT